MANERFKTTKTYTMAVTTEAMHDHYAQRRAWLNDKSYLGGTKSKYVYETLDRAHGVVELMERTHRGWIAEKQVSLTGYLDSVTPAKAREHYMHGLDMTIKQAFQNRVKEAGDAATVNVEMTDERIQDIVASYFIDFYGILKFAQKKDISPEKGIKLAERNFNFSLYDMQQLYDEYQDLPPSVVTQALSLHTEPKAFLDKVKNNIATLTAGYPDLPKSEILYAAAKNPDNPEGFLRKREQEIRRLTPLFPDMRPYDIAYAAVNRPQDPEGFLREMRNDTRRLSSAFPEFDSGQIAHAALFAKGSPEKFLRRARSTIKRLKAHYPDIPQAHIERVAFYASTKPEETLDGIKQDTERLGPLYPEFPRSDIMRIATNWRSDPDARLKELREKFNELKGKYPDIQPSVVKRIVTNGTQNPEQFLDVLRKSVTRLTAVFSTVYPGMPKFMITMATVKRPENPESYLNELFVRIKQIKQQNPDLPLNIVHLIAPLSEEARSRHIEDFRRGKKVDEEKLTNEAAEIDDNGKN